MTDIWGYAATPHKARYRSAESSDVCASCGWNITHALHNEDAITTALATPADERDTAQWFAVNSHMAEIRTALKPFPVFRYGSLVSWNQLPSDAKLALRMAFSRVRAMVD